VTHHKPKGREKMKCDICGANIVEVKTTDEAPYFYDMSGLKNVYLTGILLERCPDCKTDAPIIPRIVQLHQVIAKALLEKEELLTGDELRFLRKQAGFSAKRFSALLFVDPSYLSRVENGAHDALGPQADKLARVIVACGKHNDNTKGVLIETADLILKTADLVEKGESPDHLVMTLEKNDWEKAAWINLK